MAVLSNPLWWFVAFIHLGLGVACYWDIRFRVIPNKLNLLLIAGGFVFQFWVLGQRGLEVGGLGGALALLVGLALYFPRILGAGDSKLLVVIGVWLGPSGFIRALIMAALVGGLMSLVALLLRLRAKDDLAPALFSARSLPAQRELSAKRRQLPYGVAITVGFFWDLFRIWPLG